MNDTPNGIQQLIEELHQQKAMRITEYTPLPGAMNNNQLYKLTTADGQLLVAKIYFQDDRKRREREFPFLQLLSAEGFTNIPRPLYESINLDCGVYEWIEGTLKTADQYTEHELFNLADFIAAIHRIDVTKGTHLLDAHMAIFSMGDLHKNIQKRIQWMEEDLAKNTLHPEVLAFMETHQCLEKVQNALTCFVQDFGEEAMTYVFPDTHRRISSIDFGPHNTLFTSEGKAMYLDFENAGMDHPLRTVIDIVNHQKTETISPALKHAFVTRYREQAQLPADVWDWFEPMRRCGLIEWHLLHLNHLRPVKINQFKFSLAHEQFDEHAFIKQKLALAERTLKAMTEVAPWF